ncbi:hypothetical protein AGMMS4956_15890 [Bacteroidia bacterium]|nr:hypothetical protein AGMMS4956_15890 [Bacteroidia bacterium]
MSSLSVSDYSISPAFNANTTNYTLIVPYSDSSITINATKAESKAKEVTGTGEKKLNVGSNPFSIVVTAEDNSTKTYTITVTREAVSNNANLASLSVTGYSISPAFNANTTNYTLTVPYSDSSITINATKADNKAQVTGTGAKNLNVVGSNPFGIVVTAEDNSTKTYTITAIREEPTFSFLVVGYNISPAFNLSITTYTLTVPNNVNSITIESTTNGNISFVGVGTKYLSVGENPFYVQVNNVEYLLIVTRQAEGVTLSNNANLSSLSVSGYNISPAFGVNIINYTLTVPNNIGTITINAAAADSKAQGVIGAGAKTLNVGSNPFSIVVTAEDNSTKTYTITVTREVATAVATQSVEPLQIYPNPTSDQITITSDQWNAVGAGSARPSIEIYNVNGALVGAYRIRPDGEMRVSQKGVFNTPLQGNTINIAHLPAGIYLVKVGNRVAKVVKQ